MWLSNEIARECDCDCKGETIAMSQSRNDVPFTVVGSSSRVRETGTLFDIPAVNHCSWVRWPRTQKNAMGLRNHACQNEEYYLGSELSCRIVPNNA